MIRKLLKTDLRKASRTSVEDTYASLKTHIRRKKWIASSNRYRVRCTATLFKDTQPSKNINSKDLAQYIAASAPLHCADGWALLGRGMDSHGRGDFDAARHLAYYAELRGAISLLAAEGIGIFDDRHFVINAPNDCIQMGTSPKKGKRGGPGTHSIAWSALEHWSDLQRSAELLGALISTAGLPLADWLGNFDTGPSFHPIGSHWLKTWGLDLQRLSHDRDARNEASYRPSRMSAKAEVNAKTTSEFFHSMWTVFEPLSNSPFDILDRHLIRLTLEGAFHARTGSSAVQNPRDFANKISSMLSNLGIEDGGKWLDFFCRRRDPDDPTMLREAQQITSTSDPRYHLQVIARAALLLRVATGTCGRLLRETQLGKIELSFWWSRLGADRGLWDSNAEPADFADLWGDVQQALEGIKTWHTENKTVEPSIERWRRERANDISILGGCERIALWGLGL